MFSLFNIKTYHVYSLFSFRAYFLCSLKIIPVIIFFSISILFDKIFPRIFLTSHRSEFFSLAISNFFLANFLFRKEIREKFGEQRGRKRPPPVANTQEKRMPLAPSCCFCLPSFLWTESLFIGRWHREKGRGLRVPSIGGLGQCKSRPTVASWQNWRNRLKIKSMENMKKQRNNTTRKPVSYSLLDRPDDSMAPPSHYLVLPSFFFLLGPGVVVHLKKKQSTKGPTSFLFHFQMTHDSLVRFTELFSVELYSLTFLVETIGHQPDRSRKTR